MSSAQAILKPEPAQGVPARRDASSAGLAGDPQNDGRDYQSPQREAAFFFGLFLRGHSADELRQDIDCPVEVLTKWRRKRPQVPSSEDFERIFEYRKRVLAIFNFLVNSDNGRLM